MSNKPEYEWDEAKNLTNIRKHGVSFNQAKLMVSLEYTPDTRKEYGEPRFIVVGRIMGRLHIMIVTPRNGKLRIISLRKANQREVKRHESKS